MTWAKLKAPVGMGACRGICITIGIIGVKIAVGTEVAVSIPLGQRGSSGSSTASGAPKAADGGCCLGVLCWEMEAGVREVACCNHSMVLMRCRLIVVVASSEGSVVSAGGEGRTGIECGV